MFLTLPPYFKTIKKCPNISEPKGRGLTVYATEVWGGCLPSHPGVTPAGFLSLKTSKSVSTQTGRMLEKCS
jgi:hypothetical protein